MLYSKGQHWLLGCDDAVSRDDIDGRQTEGRNAVSSWSGPAVRRATHC